MSKGAFNGLLKGKLGNTVFYKVTNSADKEKQGQRQYVATIANPRTTPQATQRMRMKPAINFYRGLADLLDHSWEGVKYGALSRQKFMQLALSPTIQQVPFVDKGESRFIPGAYPISLGSVGVNTQGLIMGSLLVNNTISAQALTWPLVFDGDYMVSTIAEFSSVLIETSNGALRDGDEITIILCYEKDGFYVPFHSYFVLDTQSSLSFSELSARVGIGTSTDGMFYRVKADNSGSPVAMSVDETGTLVAAGIIVSRHPNRTSTTWLRSSSSLVLSKAFTDVWMSSDRFAAALATYKDSSTDLTSDWLLNQAGSASGNAGSGGSGGLIQDFTLVNQSLTPTSGTAQQRAFYNDGVNEGYVCDSAELIEGATSHYALVGPYEVENNTIVRKGDMSVPLGTKIVSLAERPSVRNKIAQFYTFM